MKIKSKIVDNIKTAIDAVYDDFLRTHGKSHDNGHIEIDTEPQSMQRIQTIEPGWLGAVWNLIYENSYEGDGLERAI